MSNPVEIDDLVVLLLGVKAANSQPGEIQGVTRLEKLIFLIERETNSKDWLDEDAKFEPYNFGPFSQRVYQAVDTLSAAGLVTDSALLSQDESDSWEKRHGIDDVATNSYVSRDFKLTERGWKYFDALSKELPQNAIRELEEFKSRFASIPLRQLVRYVYQRYDSFTTKSVIREDILGPDA
ncbi:hypothetical protein [Clavibacter nebraskensis]|uniref:Antitoxin SocA-like Panacea domain-containing protein n=2 Tax=Clavibacter nebraskensis TaxID=31963 RepID=A0AAI8ZJR5_9MICO|nr:hypothetical protein [Clavibacter nebraskensis]QKO03381.1 hypothetical protein EGX35_14840 [Clavibacter nebraskensis]QLL36504.1 hypothetical protein EGX36_14885 [Clavibacter nebraskensis]QLL36608.1 hypothetical protein EGX37_14840 [Clavibacter nebraskensis]UKF28655.1 hypothetical protein FGQ65_10895 [Clavibacter nebraskensis]UQB04826.1 hypothetical protein LIV34_002704 [Clavibacter nebraskensis]